MTIEVHDELPSKGVIDGRTYGNLYDLIFAITARRSLATTTATTRSDNVTLVA